MIDPSDPMYGPLGAGILNNALVVMFMYYFIQFFQDWIKDIEAKTPRRPLPPLIPEKVDPSLFYKFTTDYNEKAINSLRGSAPADAPHTASPHA